MALVIIPDRITLSGNESVRFAVHENGRPVQVDGWEVRGKGKLVDGVFTSPPFALIGKRYVVTARRGDDRVSAEIETTPSHTWIAVLWTYQVTVVLLCALGIWQLWPSPQPLVPVVAGPALVTLKQGDAQVFTSSAKVEWPGLTDGRFEAKGGAGSSRVFSSEAGQGSMVSVVETQAVSLKITPGHAVARAGQKVVLEARLDAPAAATGEDFKLSWELAGEGKLVNGEFTAPAKIDAPAVAILTVHTGKPGYAASARVLLLPEGTALTSETPGWLLILMAALCGALGATLHGINSLAAYVGARQFLSSWAVYYLARPFVGGLLAPMVFLVFRSNLVGDAQRTVTADWLSIAALSALSGLFADKAVRKLEQVVEVVFGPAPDPRPHKLEAEESAAPTVDKLEPETVASGSGVTTVKIAGTNFATGTKVKVDGAERASTFKSATEVEFALTAEETAAAGELKVQAVAGGKTSNEKSLTVT